MEKIKRVTGLQVSECNCKECQSQCKTPCLGTPKDILRLIKAGYTEHLAASQWIVGCILGFHPEPITMIQPKKVNGYCVFYQNGKCAIHHTGLKPIEGKLSHHDNEDQILSGEGLIAMLHNKRVFEKSLSWNVAKEWIEPENMFEIIKLLAIYKSLKAL